MDNITFIKIQLLDKELNIKGCGPTALTFSPDILGLCSMVLILDGNSGQAAHV